MKKFTNPTSQCKFCCKILSANSANGVTHLTRHGKKCFEKHHGGPRQTQVAFNPDGSVSSWSYDPAVARESLARFITSTDSPISIGESPFYEEHIRRVYCPQF